MSSINDKKLETLSHDAIVRALFENYESIYVVDAETSAYRCFHESGSYSSLRIEDRGYDFFQSMENNILRTIYEDDRDFVRKMLSKEALHSSLNKEKFYSFVYRLMIDGKPLYHKLRATKDLIDGHQHFLIGIRNIDTAYRLDKSQEKKLSSMHRKERNHLEAILASAEGYLEANLSKDAILEISPIALTGGIHPTQQFTENGIDRSYTVFIKRQVEKMVVKNKDQFIKIADRQYLINCFGLGEKRASVSFSMKAAGGQPQPCRLVFYLYQDTPSGDILSFCVLYDLTEQQRKEKELRELENELQMSRLRNFTSQMQPHFLYNALGSIQEIVLDDPAYASELIGDFTIHLRSCIRAMSNDAPIPFEQELSNIKAYVNIEKMRFGDKLKVNYDIQTYDFSILPLSVQPVVENAIRHGIYERGEQGGTVVIKTEKSDSATLVTVADNGVGFDVDAYFSAVASGKQDSAGLKNIMFRLEKVMQASVAIDSRIGEGTTVTIVIPKEGAKNEGDNS
nr:histidine kinase [Clostridia bacterium]